jgi:hypothetical protein
MKYLLVLFLLLPSWSLSEEKGLPVQVSQNQLIRLSENGIEPKELRMSLEDSILFLLNDSRNSLATVEVQFGGKTTHCASTNLAVTKDQLLRSKRPFGPHDFASLCFHERGIYPFRVFGLPSNPKGIDGVVYVE